MTDADLNSRVDDLLELIRQQVRPLHIDDRFAVLMLLSSRLCELNDDTVDTTEDAR